MPYMVRCRYCNKYFFSTVKRDVEESIIDHICDKHSAELVEYRILRISSELYMDILRCKDNPRFWQSLRLVRKPSKIPPFLIGLKGDKP